MKFLQLACLVLLMVDATAFCPFQRRDDVRRLLGVRSSDRVSTTTSTRASTRASTSSSTRSAATTAMTAATTAREPFCLHPIDYSAANEYIAEHYGYLYGNDSAPYFGQAEPPSADEANSDVTKPVEPVFNARDGLLLSSADTQPSLDRNGFELLSAPTEVTDWNNLPEIRSTYLSELREMVNRTMVGSDLSHVIFWNPMLRGETKSVRNTERDMRHANPPTSPTAGMVHIDQDLGAHDAASIVSLIRNNCINDTNKDAFPYEEIVGMIEDGHRFAVVNFWRNADFQHPVQRQPLAVYATSYNDDTTTCFPACRPGSESRWYTYPNMRHDECLVFKQYDRDASRPSDIWHCALKSILGDATAPPRSSFDIRGFLVFRTRVEESRDRFGPNRLRPVLDIEESASFCKEQAEKQAERQAQQ